MKSIRLLRCCAVAALLASAAWPSGAADDVKEAEPPFRIAVLDFTAIDIEGQKFYRFVEQTEAVPTIDMITAGDRASIDDRMLGLVKMMEVGEEIARRGWDRARLDAANDRERERIDALAKQILDSRQRAIVIGAEYMTAALGRHPDVFAPVARRNLERALLEVELGRGLTEEEAALGEFGRVSGADYVLYGTVGDFRTREQTFRGYRIETKTVEYSLDLIVKVADLATREVIFSDVVTGTYTERPNAYSEVKDDGIFQELLKSAAQAAADGMYSQFRPAVAAPAVAAAAAELRQLNVVPRGAEQAEIEIYIDGKFRGNAPATLAVAPGVRIIELRLGDRVWKRYEMEIAGGETLAPRFDGGEQ